MTGVHPSIHGALLVRVDDVIRVFCVLAFGNGRYFSRARFWAVGRRDRGGRHILRASGKLNLISDGVRVLFTRAATRFDFPLRVRRHVHGEAH